MNKIIVVSLAGVLSFFFSALPALAHHSASMFEPAKVVTIKGTVKEFEYTNPHSWLIIDSMSSDGKVATWSFELGTPIDLMRAGIVKNDLAPGMGITVTGHPMRDGRTAASMVKAVRADGRVFYGSARPPKAGSGSAGK